MNTERRIGPHASAALFCLALVILASSCGPSTGPALSPTSPSPPEGGIMKNDSCQLLKLTLSATTYRLTHTTGSGSSSSGNVVVADTEIDLFNADVCGLKLPDGIGRYMWKLEAGVVHFTPLNSDPCPAATTGWRTGATPEPVDLAIIQRHD